MTIVSSLAEMGVSRCDTTYRDRMLRFACEVARTRSMDPDTQVGCVAVLPNDIVIADANRFPDGVAPLPERLVRPEKYRWIAHSEIMVVAGAAARGHALEGAEIFLTWHPCAGCAVSLAAAGVRRIHGIEPDFSAPRWGEEFSKASRILAEADIGVHFADAPRTVMPPASDRPSCRGHSQGSMETLSP